ncbi:MAG: VWA domain-containing protein, partial [Limisphaerales bacterium]
LVLISDLYEGGNAQEMLKRMANIVTSGVQVIALLALNDEGAPAFDHNHAAAFALLEVPSFAWSRKQLSMISHFELQEPLFVSVPAPLFRLVRFGKAIICQS